MALDKKVEDVLKKYKIMNPETGKIRSIKFRVAVSDVKKPVEVGPIIDLDVIAALVKADTTPDYEWVDWIFFQAGGGQEAWRNRDQVYEEMRQAGIESLKYEYGYSEEKARRIWEKEKSDIAYNVYSGTEDILIRFANRNIFGYFRHMPGRNRIYEKIINTVPKFISLIPDIIKFNKELLAEELRPFPYTPDTVENIDHMIAIMDKYERYKKAFYVKDILEVEVIYEDSNVVALAPLSYSAAVRFGFPSWPESSKALFSDTLKSGKRITSSHPWGKYIFNQKDIVIPVYFKFKVPMPAYKAVIPLKHLKAYDLVPDEDSWNVSDIEVENDSDELRTYAGKMGHFYYTTEIITLQNLRLEMDANKLKTPIHSWEFSLEYVNGSYTYKQIKDMLEYEVNRPRDDERVSSKYGFGSAAPDIFIKSPLHRGANVFTSRAQVKNVLTSFDLALRAVYSWYRKLTPEAIKDKFKKGHPYLNIFKEEE